jgi:hypothetical protein
MDNVEIKTNITYNDIMYIWLCSQEGYLLPEVMDNGIQ